MATRTPCVEIVLKGETEIGYCVKPHHYERLKQALDEHEKGWLELESIYGDGKVFIEIPDIKNLFLMTESYCEERNQKEQEDKLTET